MSHQGIVKWYDTQKHFGFITEDGEGKKDIFIHKSNIDTTDQALEKEQRVSFEIRESEKGQEATDVKPLNE